MLCTNLFILVLFDENNDKLKLFFVSFLTVYVITLDKLTIWNKTFNLKSLVILQITNKLRCSKPIRIEYLRMNSINITHIKITIKILYKYTFLQE